MLLGDASLQDADDTALVPELEGLVDRCAQHDGYGLSDELLGALLVENPSHIYLAGLDVDAHVMHAAFQLFNAGLRPIVIAPLCGSTGGRSAALHALALLRRNIGVQNVLPSLPWRATPVDGTTAVAALPIPGISASRMFQ
jgi:nicotinamidase-related amidase